MKRGWVACEWELRGEAWGLGRGGLLSTEVGARPGAWSEHGLLFIFGRGRHLDMGEQPIQKPQSSPLPSTHLEHPVWETAQHNLPSLTKCRTIAKDLP